MIDSLENVIIAFCVVGILAELFAMFTKTYRLRQLTYLTVFITIFFNLALLMTLKFNILLGAVIFIGLFRAFNAARAIADRMHHKRMLSVTKRSSIYLVIYQLVSAWALYLSYQYEVTNKQLLLCVALVSLPISLIILGSTIRTLRRSSVKSSDNFIPDIEMPTVSVCIPARNETDDLAACLQSVVDSDYPKLEVLVLDDCSHDKTSEIIKGFARKGVRFISGDEPKKGWLAKNQAYEALSKSASGDILVFCGVDVRLGKKALKSIVATMKSREKQMISVLPTGEQDYKFGGIIQPIRYWWEIVLPRRLFNRPAVLSTLWAIDSKIYKKFGGLNAVGNMVIPEGYFARQATVDDGYSFMRVSGDLDIKSAKQIEDQWNTAVRVRYPRLRQRPESVALVALFEFFFWLLPIMIFLVGFTIDLGVLWIICGAVSIVLGIVQFRVVEAYRPNATALYILLLPVSLVFDLIVLCVSMYRYEFGKVIWKERNVCIPVMQTVPKLPKV